MANEAYVEMLLQMLASNYILAQENWCVLDRLLVCSYGGSMVSGW